MTRFVPALLALLLAPAAHAQQPMQIPGLTPKGEAAFVVADTESLRFFAIDETSKGPSLTEGEAVTVVVRAEGRVRFLVRGRFGWVPESALSSEPPAPPELPGTNDPLLPPG